MQIQPPVGNGQGHRRVGLDIGQLGNNVFPDQGVRLFPLGSVLIGLHDGLGRIRIAQPVAHGGQMVQTLAAGNSAHGPTVGVAADDDIHHLEGGHRIFHRGRNTAGFGTVGGNDIPRVADDEQVARILLGKQLRYHPAVGTGHKQRFGALSLCQRLKQAGSLGIHLTLKLQEPFYYFLHRQSLQIETTHPLPGAGATIRTAPSLQETARPAGVILGPSA